MASGSIITTLTILAMALASTYAGMMAGYVIFGLARLTMLIPAKSVYGDLVNYAK
ncbi:hypothetical protein GGF37_001533, partial [Kickxella alabastrina]